MSEQLGKQVSAAEEPHPEINGLLQQMGAAPMPPLWSLSPKGGRAFVEGMFPDPEEPEPIADVMDVPIDVDGGEIPLRVYIPEAEGPFPTLIYLHGGGWATGSLDGYDPTCRALTKAANCMVVSVGYRLSPEHKFPTPLEDCYTAAEWVIESAEAMQIDTDNIAIAGDSAGGNLAAAVTLLARERGDFSFDRQVLIYPVLDHSFDTESYEENAEGYLLTKADMKYFWDLYLRDEIDSKSPYASPLQANNLEALPPATIVTCGFDPLRDEGAAYAAELTNADVDVNHIHYDDGIHGLIQLLVEPMDLTPARELIAEISDDLITTFD
ncbi:alpha/beta hydrolase [Haladaptatus sp. DFWS20]|uniref:alpha/beta hydrolase n=1 Tax=Haladaptatus sp. DFWS20 TaxID=3403467 RepID=UPI003EB9ED70